MKVATAMVFKLPPATNVSRISVSTTMAPARMSGISRLTIVRAVQSTFATVVAPSPVARDVTKSSRARTAWKKHRAMSTNATMARIVQDARTKRQCGCPAVRELSASDAVTVLASAKLHLNAIAAIALLMKFEP